MTDSPAPRSARKNRLVLLALFAVFFLPIFVAFALNVELPGWLPFGQTNHGNLIQPALQLETSGLSRVEGAPAGEELLQRSWSLLHIEAGACLTQCDRAVYRMRQSRYAMGKDMERIQRLVVVPAEQVRDAAERLFAIDPALTVLAASRSWLNLPRPGQGEAEIYIVDPQGYVIMWYRADADPGGLIKDLKRLLKISKIG